MTTSKKGTKNFSEKTANLKEGRTVIMSEKKKTIALEKCSYDSKRAIAEGYDNALSDKSISDEIKAFIPAVNPAFKSHVSEFLNEFHEKHARSQGKAFLRAELPQSEALYTLCEELNKAVAKANLKDSDGFVKVFSITTPKMINLSEPVKALFSNAVVSQQVKLDKPESEA
jgi:hypothetical protein